MFSIWLGLKFCCLVELKKHWSCTAWLLLCKSQFLIIYPVELKDYLPLNLKIFYITGKLTAPVKVQIQWQALALVKLNFHNPFQNKPWFLCVCNTVF